MNLIDESFEPKKVDNSKKTTKIILIIISILIAAIIGIVIAIMYIQENTLKLYINGVVNEKVKEMMVEEADGTIYFPIKEISSYLGYQSFNGEYADKSEEASKCYIQCDDEIVNFTLNSKTLYKLETSDSNANYEYYNSKKPVKAINGKLYASIDAIENAFNITFINNVENKKINIYTMPYLIDFYSSKVLDYGYEQIDENYKNKKTILKDMLVVVKDQGKTYAVIDTQGNSVIEPKYSNIEYLPNLGDFLVTSNNKVGLISSKKERKIQLSYDSLQLIDSNTGLFLANKQKKYGIIDSKGNTKVNIEYDEIGIDITKFEQNGIKNKYLLDNGMIPARKGKLWGAFDKNGNNILDFEYDSLGYIATTDKDAINLLIIPDYNVMVVAKDKKYALVNSVGERLCNWVLDDVYMTINGGTKYYYMNFNNTSADVLEFLDEIDVKPSKKSNRDKETESEDTKKEQLKENLKENILEENTVKQENQIDEE
ncbi:MAG: hypothetical protein HFJ59_05955 [Clostridia bacterium]|nr:hypothetical protein [Clostridia bacterium]